MRCSLVLIFCVFLCIEVNVAWKKQFRNKKNLRKDFTKKFKVQVPVDQKPQNITEDEIEVFNKVLNDLTNRLQIDVKFNEESATTSNKPKVGCSNPMFTTKSKEKGIIIPITSPLQDLTLLSLKYEEIGFWSRCTRSCKSRRARKCRLPGLCSVDFLIEEAHCYVVGSKCEKKVLKELEIEQPTEGKNDDEHSHDYNDHDHDDSYDTEDSYTTDHQHDYEHSSHHDHSFEHDSDHNEYGTNDEHDHRIDYHNEHRFDYDHHHDYDHNHDDDHHHDHDHNHVEQDYVIFTDYPVFEDDSPSYSYGDPDIEYDSHDGDHNHNDEECDDYPQENENNTEKEPPVCGKSKASVPYESYRIIGGREALKGAWPWQVAVVDRYGEIFCGGTLIHGSWVLTAAHCVKRRLSVRLADHDVSRYDGEMSLKVKRAFVHPDYDEDIIDNDIALLRLPKNVIKSGKKNIGLACLPPEDRYKQTSKSCVVLGWGKERETHIFGSDVLMYAKVPIVNMKKCRRAYHDRTMTNNMICAGYLRGGPDSCEGDSGGPLLCLNDDKQWVLEGVTSFGEGCGDRGKIGVYAKVPNYLQWINETISRYD